MNNEPNVSRRTFRLPPDAASFLEQEAKRNFTSQNAEVVRLIRERMAREAAGDEGSIKAPAASGNRSGLQSAGNING